MKEFVAVGLTCCAVMLAMHTTPRASSDWERRLDDGLRAVADSPAATPVRIVVSTRIGTSDIVQQRMSRAGATQLRVVAKDQLGMQVKTGMLKAVAEDADVTHLMLDAPLRAADSSAALLSGSALVGTQALLPRTTQRIR